MNESQRIAAENRDRPAHLHGTGAAHHGQEAHLTGQELSRQGQEHVNPAYLQAQAENQKGRVELAAEAIAREGREQEVATLAHELWHGRGCPEGSPEQDWFQAAEKLRSGR